jgi:hypothetical protein
MLVNKICEHLSQRIQAGQLNNKDMVQIIEHIGGYLNIKTRSEYAKKNNMSYNGAKKFRQNIDLFGVKFIVDNL